MTEKNYTTWKQVQSYTNILSETFHKKTSQDTSDRTYESVSVGQVLKVSAKRMFAQQVRNHLTKKDFTTLISLPRDIEHSEKFPFPTEFRRAFDRYKYSQ